MKEYLDTGTPPELVVSIIVRAGELLRHKGDLASWRQQTRYDICCLFVHLVNLEFLTLAMFLFP